MHLTYETRISAIARSLNTFLRQFKVPEHLDQEAALQRIRMTADAINKRLPASLHASDLDARLADAFVRVLETAKSREWPNVEAFVAAIGKPAPSAEKSDAGSDRGDRASLSRDQAQILEAVILPRARRWLNTGLHEHGQKTLEFWGERA